MKRHAHKGLFHLYSGIQGDLDLTVADNIYTLQKGRGVLIAPETDHAFGPIACERLVCYELKFIVHNPELHRGLLRIGPLITYDEFIETAIHSLAKAGSSGMRHFRRFAQYTLGALICYILGREADNDAASAEISGISPATQKAFVVINEQYMHPLSLEFIAQSTGYNKNYICTVFKKDTGLNINEYLNMVRIKNAADRLSNGDFETAQVAAMCGFNSVAHFSRTFKRHVGVSPGYYRNFAQFAHLDAHSDSMVEEDAFNLSVLTGKLAKADEILKPSKTIPDET